MLSKCCKSRLVPESGFLCCPECGRLGQQALDTRNVSYNHSTSMIVRPYSRKSRFEKKVLGLLRCLVNYRIDDDLFYFLKHRKINTPEGLHQEIGLYPTKGRRPFDAIMYYWIALGKRPPRCTDNDILFLKQDFDQIFFAWDRLGFQRPQFPYSFLFRKIVQANPKKYSKGMSTMTRFVRVLQCQKRRKRYSKLFKKCFAFDYLNMDQSKPDDEKIDPQETFTAKPNSDGQEIISHEKIDKPMILSPYDVAGVYKTRQEVDEAIARKDFDVSKTMHVDKQGRFFFLTY